MSSMNDSGLLRATGLTDAQQACVDLLEEALGEAKRGMIHTVGIVACMKSGYGSVMAGSQAADLNLGCDSLKKKILAAVEDDGNRARVARVR
jgi:hypothetical protein